MTQKRLACSTGWNLELESKSNLDLNRGTFCGSRTETGWNLRPKAGRLADFVCRLLVSQGRMNQEGRRLCVQRRAYGVAVLENRNMNCLGKAGETARPRHCQSEVCGHAVKGNG